MVCLKRPEQSGRDHYDAIYAQDLAAEARWLELCAPHKADSVQRLLRARANTLVEIGAGTGAVLQECFRRGLADHYVAVDYSQLALDYIKQTFPAARTVKLDLLKAEDVEKIPHGTVVLSHVLEHLEKPEVVLHALARQGSRQVLAEVPLEDLMASRIKGLFRDKYRSASGHVRFYTRSSFDKLVTECGFKILGRRCYYPILSPETVRYTTSRFGMWYWRVYLTGRLMPALLGPLHRSLYYAHYAVLLAPN